MGYCVLLTFFSRDQDGHFDVLQHYVLVLFFQNVEVPIHGDCCANSVDVLWNPVLALADAKHYPLFGSLSLRR